MSQLGYERVCGARAWLSLLHALLRLPADAARAARLNRSRMGRPLAYVWRRLSFSVGGR
jgi:hypothetical protein